METSKKEALILVEPFFHGVQYINAAKEVGCDLFILRRPDSPIIHDDYIVEEIVVDLFDIELLKEILEKKMMGKNYINIGILPGNEQCVAIVAELNNLMGLIGNPPSAALAARNKIIMRESLKRGNLNCPQIQTFYNMKKIFEFKNNFIYPLVVKPPDMSGSKYVRLVNNFEELIEAANNIFNLKTNILNYPLTNAVMIEEYVSGLEFSVEILLDNGNLKFASVTEKHKGNLPYFVEIGHVVPSSITTSNQNQNLIDTAYKTALTIGLENGPAHVELILNENGATVVELAARIGGDKIMQLIKLASNTNIPLLVIHQVLKHDLDHMLNKSFSRGAAIRFLTATPGRITGITGVDEVRKETDVVEVNVNVKIGDYIHPLRSSDERVGDIVVVGENSKKASEKASQMANKIEFCILKK